MKLKILQSIIKKLKRQNQSMEKNNEDFEKLLVEMESLYIADINKNNINENDNENLD